MRKTSIVLIAVVSLGLAGLSLVALGPGRVTHTSLSAANSTTVDVLGFTHKARDLPEQSYPAH